MFKKIFFRKRGRSSSKCKYKPCIISAAQAEKMLDSEILSLYKPAFKKRKAKILIKQPEERKFSYSQQEIQEIKNNLRYVWCDGSESAVWEPRNCKYLGIRLTDSFILHETIVTKTWGEFVYKWRDKCQARFLFREELMLLQYVWSAVSMMRFKAGDTLMPLEQIFWIAHPEAQAGKTCYRMDRNGKILETSREDEACLLFAVCN